VARAKKIKNYWDVHFLRLELLLSIAIGIGFGMWMYLFSGSQRVDTILSTNRGAVYGTLAAIFGALLGFVITTLSIIIGYLPNERFDFLRQSPHFPTLGKVLISTIRVLSVATIMMVVGLIFDRDSAPQHLILCLSVFIIILALFRLWRCIWVLENVIKIIV
jgi:hypothetical protein